MISANMRSTEDLTWVITQLKNHEIINLIQAELNLIKEKALIAIERLNLDNNLSLNYLIELLNYSVNRVNL